MVVDRSIRHLEHSHILLNIMELDIPGRTYSLSRKSTCKSAVSTHTEREIDKIYNNGLQRRSQESMQAGDEKLKCNTYSGLSVSSMVSTQQRQYAVCVHRSIAYRIMSNATNIWRSKVIFSLVCIPSKVDVQEPTYRRNILLEQEVLRLTNHIRARAW